MSGSESFSSFALLDLDENANEAVASLSVPSDAQPAAVAAAPAVLVSAPPSASAGETSTGAASSIVEEKETKQLSSETDAAVRETRDDNCDSNESNDSSAAIEAVEEASGAEEEATDAADDSHKSESESESEDDEDESIIENDVLDTGLLYMWGQAEYGQCGLRGAAFWRPSLCTALRGRPARQVATGFRHTLILLASGHVFGLGANSFGQLGLSSGTCRKTPPGEPQFVDQLKSIRFIACGSQHSAAIDTNGRLYTFGFDSHNQLGREGTPHLPQLVTETLTDKINVVQVALGAEHSCALDDQGALFSWGRGTDGQLGYGSGFDHVLPRRIDALRHKRILQVQCGVSFSLALDENNSIWSWGENSQGQLGRGRGCNGSVPQPIRALRDKHVREVWCGWRHAGMITEAGDVWTWGHAKFHQLGLGSTEDQYHPRLVKGVLSSHSVVQVSAGWKTTLYRTDWGGVFAAGAPRYGQLGVGRKYQVAPLPYATLMAGNEVRGDEVASDGSGLSCPVDFVSCGGEHAVAMCAALSSGATVAGSSLARDLRSLLDDAQHADVHFECSDGSIVHGHRLLLRARSCFFAQVLPEKHTLPVRYRIGAESAAVRALVEFLYTDWVDDLRLPLVDDVRALACAHKLDRLAVLCDRRAAELAEPVGDGAIEVLPALPPSQLRSQIALLLNDEQSADTCFEISEKGRNDDEPGAMISAHALLLKARAPELCKVIGGVWQPVAGDQARSSVFTMPTRALVADDKNVYSAGSQSAADESKVAVAATGGDDDGNVDDDDDDNVTEVVFIEDVKAAEFRQVLNDVYGVRGELAIQRNELLGLLRAAALYKCRSMTIRCVTALLDDSVGGVMLTPSNAPFLMRMAVDLSLPRLANYCRDMLLSDWEMLESTDFAGLSDEDRLALEERREEENIDLQADIEAIHGRRGSNNSNSDGVQSARTAASNVFASVKGGALKVGNRFSSALRRSREKK